MKKFAFLLVIFIIKINWARAEIITYSNNTSRVILNKNFPEGDRIIELKLDNQNLQFNLKNQDFIDLNLFLKNELPILGLKNSSFKKIELQSITPIENNTFAIRFKYSYDLGKIDKSFPFKASLLGKSILVRLKNGKIESINAGTDFINENYIYKQINKWKNLTSEDYVKIENFTLELIKNNSEFSRHLFLRLLKNNKSQLITNLKNLRLSDQTHESTFDFLFNAMDLIKNLSKCEHNCQLVLWENFKMKYTQFEEWLLNSYYESNRFLSFLKIAGPETAIEVITEPRSNTLHLQISAPDLDSKIDLSLNTSGIVLTKLQLSSDINSFEFIENTRFTPYNPNYKSTGKNLIITNEDFKTYSNLNSLDTTEKKLANIFLFNQDFYQKNFNLNYIRDEKFNLVIKYDIKYPSAKADGASWNYYPISQFYIGAGDKIFKNISEKVDVISHEYFHAIEEQTSKLHSLNESGALREHGGDFFGMILREIKNQELNDTPKFAIGCDILTAEAISNFQNVHSGSNPDCLRNFLFPERSWSKQATDKNSIKQFLKMDDYETMCWSTLDNDDCGVHFQTGIPNKIIANFILNLKISLKSLNWKETLIFTSRIVYNTFVGRLQSGSDFLDYATQLNDECLLQSKLISNINEQNSVITNCHQLKEDFVNVLKK